MNEQIRTILAEDGTKTSKIRKLLLLGLTHREIADLVTRGNRGFVWNVYKRMRDEGLIVSAGTPTATTTPELDYSFRRKFGVEIEAYNCTCQRLVRELTEAGIEVASERYNHDLRPHWKLVTDSSLNGNDTFELVSPILEGEDGLEKLERVCWVLDSCNVKINGSCGLHVHMNAEDFNITTWRNLLLSYKHAEAEIDKFMPASRRGGSNTYCGSLIQFPDERIRSARNIRELQGLFPSRYMKVNLQAYSRHRTVEFRQHSGTISFTKILIFHGATNGNIIIPVPPIRRQTLAEPVYTFSYKQEMKIVSFPHHFPCFYTPFIGFFYQKIGGKTSIDEIAGRDLVSLILFPPHGQIELSGFGYYGTVFPMFTISAIYITMPATCT